MKSVGFTLEQGGPASNTTDVLRRRGNVDPPTPTPTPTPTHTHTHTHTEPHVKRKAERDEDASTS